MHQEDENDYLSNDDDNDVDFGHGEHLVTGQFMLEIVMLSLVPIPGYDHFIIINCLGKDTVYLLSEFMLVFMFCRIYFVVRSMLNYTQFMDPYAKKLCKSYGFENSILFTIKSNLMIQPEKTAALIFIVTLFLFSYVIRVFEMPRFRHEKFPDKEIFDQYFNSIWFTVITLTTIGYGDFSPMTTPGKMCTIILAFWGSLLMALLVVVLSSIFELNDSEKMALRHVQYTKTAANTISQAFKFF